MTEFLEKLKKAAAIKCNRQYIMDGDLLYHILAIHDETAVTVKYYGKHRQYWHYHTFHIIELFMYYEKGWIELRGKK